MLSVRILLISSIILLSASCDSWEDQHRQQIMTFSQDASVAALAGRNFEAVEKADQAIALVGDRQLKSPSGGQALAEAKKAKADAQSKIQAFVDKREEAKAQLAAGEYGASAASCDGLLKMLAGQSHAEAFIATVEKMRAEAQGKEAEHAEQLRQAEAKRQREAAEQLAKDTVRRLAEVRKAEAAEQERIATLRAKGFAIPTVEIVDIDAVSELSGNFITPRWSVDHEIRVNGKKMDSTTNSSGSCSFSGVEVKIGDKITCKSMWKNGYGATSGDGIYGYTENDGYLVSERDITAKSIHLTIFKSQFDCSFYRKQLEERRKKGQ